MAHVVYANEHHCLDLAPELREDDLRELRAVGRDNPLETLVEAIALPGVHLAGIRDGRCRVMFGAAHLGSDTGSAWLLASPDIYRWRHEFLAESLMWVEFLHAFWGTLGNWVDDRNEVSQRWLRRLGFRPCAAEPEFGVERRPFTFYVSER